LSQAKDVIHSTIGELLSIQWKKESTMKINNFQYRPDFEAEVTIGNKKQRLLIEVKNSGEPMIIAQLASYAQLIWDKFPDTYLVLVAPFVSSRGRDFCKELGIGFIDLEGNAFIRFDGVLIERFGKQSDKKEKRLQRKLFTTKSTWIMRKMLAEPKRTWTTQDLADAANVSLGMVYKATEKLMAEGYMDKARGAISLQNPGELLDAWREIYHYKDQEATGYYSPIETREDLYKRLRRLSGSSYALTLGAGASLAAPFVRSTDTHLYIDTDFEELRKALDLTPVEFGGNVYIVVPSDKGVLFDTQTINMVTVVSNLQLYLDLYNYPQRGREQADFLRGEKMKI